MISVCMATYNGAKYITEQISSIIPCISEKDEIIISDDGSTDGTLNILEKFASDYSNIRIVKGPSCGLIANFSNALSQAKGDIIFLSDQDDIWYPDKVSKVLQAFSQGDYALVVHNARLVDADGKPIGSTLFELRHSKTGFFKNLVKNSYVGCCMAVKRDLLTVALPIPVDIEMHDWWLGLLSEVTSKSIFVDEVLIDYRRHGSNCSSMDHYPLKIMVKNRLLLIKEIVKRVTNKKRKEKIS